MTKVVAFVLLAGMALGAANSATAQAAIEPHVQDALDNPLRLAADRERDAARKPGEVLSLAGVMPGMTVLDVFSGGGYYSEILSHLVGSDGQVIAHYNDAYQIFVGKEFDARYADNRLANVWTYKAEANEIDLEAGSVDAAIFILGFHDIYNYPTEYVWPAIDAKLFMEKVYRAITEGGSFVIIDHTAAAGSLSETGGTVHRIDPAIVKSVLIEVGFEYVGASDILRNPDDDPEMPVFNPAIRGNTDRFILKFRKPVSANE